MKTTEQIKTELKDALPVHFHQGDPEPHLTPFNFHALECLHADALSYIQQLEAELDMARLAFAHQSTEVAEWQLKALKTVQQIADTVPKWISVEERLPDGEVLAANFAPGTYGYKEYLIGYVSVVKCTEPDWEKGKCYATNDFEILNNVTHWMPLPEAPEEVAE